MKAAGPAPSPGRRSGLWLALAAVLGSVALVVLAQDEMQRRHGPPWDAAVASTHSFQIAHSTIQVDFGPGSLDLPTQDILQWVENAASSVATYYGQFPVPRDRVLIQPREDTDDVGHGTTWGGVGGFPSFTRISVGQHTTMQELNDDWMMTHEFVHTGLPSQADEHHWLEEGSAVYVEPVARVQNGLLRPEKIWADMMRDMPKGNPQPGDEGLDRTHTWGRTYWGGAQFCLLADVTIREQTYNRKGLQDALRAIIAAGGTIDEDWDIDKTLRAGDAGTRTHVLEDLYHRMSDAPVPVDLEGIWKKLGIIRTGVDQVRFDDHAPEAAIRIAITKTPPWGRIKPQP